jgi:hypothetical protein
MLFLFPLPYGANRLDKIAATVPKNRALYCTRPILVGFIRQAVRAELRRPLLPLQTHRSLWPYAYIPLFASPILAHHKRIPAASHVEQDNFVFDINHKKLDMRYCAFSEVLAVRGDRLDYRGNAVRECFTGFNDGEPCAHCLFPNAR